jgi:methanogenic corrinoid protein MtbC1
VHYLGTDLPQRDIIREILRAAPRLLAVSVTMAYNIGRLGELIGAVRLAAGPEVKVLAGGAAFEGMPGRAQQLGCDAFARNLTEAQAAARALAT